MGKKSSKKVTNLKITRTGMKFKAEWKNPTSWNTLKIQHRRKVDGKWKDWTSYTTLNKKATSYSWTDSNSYYPGSGSDPSGAKLNCVEVRVYSDQGSDYTYSTNTATYDIDKPYMPKVKVTAGASSTSFEYSVSSGNDIHHAFTKVRYRTAHANNYQDPKNYSGWSAASHDTHGSATKTEAIGWTEIPAGGSITSMFKIRALGPGGEGEWNYGSYTYGFPYKATGIELYSDKNISGGYELGIKWDRKSDKSHPSKKHKVEYYIGNPRDTALNCPTSGINWNTATDPEYTDDDTSKAKQQCVFKTNARVQAEECLWVRVTQLCIGTLTTVSDSYRLKTFDKLVKPTIDTITYNAETHELSVTVSPNTALRQKTWLDIRYILTGKAAPKYRELKELSLSNVGHDSLTFTTTLNLAAQQAEFWAWNVYGDKQSDAATRTFEPTESALSPVNYYPTKITAAQYNNSGAALVSWTNTMKGVTSAEVKVTTDAAGLEVVKTESEDGAGINNMLITGLSFGSTYYFRVRTTNEAGTSAYSTTYGSITMKADKAPSPNITLSEDATHAVVISWSWNTWSYATGIEILYSRNAQEYRYSGAKWDSIERNGRTGTDYHIVSGLERGDDPWYVWARFVSGSATTDPSQKQIVLALTPVAPTEVSFARAAQATDEVGKTTAQISWANNWKDAVKTVLTWDTSPSAWETTSGAGHSADLTAGQSSTLIADLELGTVWYAKVRAVYNDEYYADSDFASLDLRTIPSTPTVSLSADVISQDGKVDVAWTYSNEDGSEQAAATVNIYDSSKVLLKTVPCVSNETAIAVYAETYGLTGDNVYYVTVQTTSTNGIGSDMSDYVPLTVVTKPIATITSTSLVDVVIDEGEATEHTIHTLQSMPLTITVTGAENGGHVLLYIEHARAQYLARPDESVVHGHEGELVAVAEGDSPFTIEQADLRTTFDENNDYRITAVVTDKRGIQSDPVTLDFTVMWAEHAVIPTATYVVDETNRIVKITPTAGQDTPQDATFEIYRLSADRPELIVASGEWGTTFVDPYPTLGEYGGHRIVCKTSTGDYTTEDGMLAWLDIEDQPLEADGRAVIDFDNSQVDFIYNVDVSHSWNKDFTETKYLGGSVQGDWNAAVSRKTSLSSVMITLIDADKIEQMRRLATHTGICHVRTPDGSSFPADVQVSESWTHDRGYKVVDFSMDITRVDAQAFEGMTLSEWEAQ